MDKDLLLVFVKNPEKGRVKTRLAESIGDERALSVYRQLMSVTKSVVDQLDCTRQVWYSRFIDEKDQWEHGVYEKRLQTGCDLGERMQHAFSQGFRDGYKNVVIIGSDCVELTPVLLRKAFESLESHEMIVGPSKDGGYYLLGMRSFHPELFEHKNWSTSSVYEETLAQIEEIDLSVKILPILNDIDTEDDLKEAAHKLRDL